MPHLPHDERRQKLARRAYSPRTKIMYFSMQNTCMTSTSVAERATPELVYAINNETVIAPGHGQRRRPAGAIAVETGKAAWRYEQRSGLTALLATAGDLSSAAT